MRSIVASLVALCAMTLVYSDVLACIQTTAYGTLTADSTIFTAQTIESCNYAGEYATVTISSAGTWTFESSVATDYLYLTDVNNVAIDSGITPVTITTTGSTVVRLHVSSDASCGTQNSCRVTSITKAPCLATTAYGTLTASAGTFTPQIIESCNYAGEYATVTLPSGGIWTFGSSIATDFLVITSTSNTVLASGTQPLSYTSSGADTLRIHIFTDANCGTQNSCRVSTVTKSPCLASTMYPSSMVSADSSIANSTSITTCNYAGEYSEVELPVAGNWQFTSNIATDFIVLTDLNNNVLASGQVPVSLGVTGIDTVRAHVFTDANCGTQSSCRSTSVVRLPCLSATQYPSSIDTVNTDPSFMSVTTCNYAGEYFEVVAYPGQSYEFTSSVAGDIFFVTDTANNFLASGTAPLIYDVVGSSPVGIRVHIFIDNGCTTQNSCRATGVTCITCAPAVSASSSSVCNGGGSSVTLSTSDTLGTTYWYAGACGSTPIDSGSSTMVSPTSSTWYYASNFYNGITSLCDSVEVVVTSGPTTTFTNVTNTTCYGVADGSATVSATGNAMPFTYAWSNSGSTATTNGLGAGDYYVTVTDTNGCNTIDTVTISEPTELTGTIAVDSNVTCNGFTDGGVTISATGGTTPYSYIWTNAATTASITGISAGTYSVTITDANGCSSTETSTVTEPTMLATTSLVDSNVTCNGLSDGGISVAATGGSAPYSYTWSNSDSTASIYALGAGTYTVTITDGNGCTQEISETITEPAAISNSFTSTDVTCDGDSDGEITSAVTGGTAPYNYVWSDSSTTASITGLSAGTYTLIVIDDNGCSYTESDSIGFMFANPTIPLADVDTVCTGFSLTLDAGNAGATYAWSSGETTQTIDVTAAGNFTVDVTDGNGCSSSHTVTVVEDICTGLNDVNSLTTIETYPNPANGILNVRIKGSVSSSIKIQLLNLSGQQVETRTVMNYGDEILEQFDVTSLSKGVYFMNFTIGSKVTTQRVVVQ